MKFFFSSQNRIRRKFKNKHRETDATMTQKIRNAFETFKQKKNAAFDYDDKRENFNVDQISQNQSDFF